MIDFSSKFLSNFIADYYSKFYDEFTFYFLQKKTFALIFFND